MFNPFVNRSIEQIRDESAFLSVVTPAPLEEHLKEYADDGRLYTLLSQIYGPPGTGKTTLARLFEFPIIAALLRNPTFQGNKETLKVLIACGAINGDDQPVVLGYRLGLEGQYRHIWELPYAEELRARLFHTLIQARAVQGWLRGLSASQVDLGEVKVLPRPGAEALLATIGGENATLVLARATEVEQAVYEITAALDPPDEEALDLTGIGPYHPFDHILRIAIPWRGARVELLPLLLLDDTSKLHPEQYRATERWLIRREMRIARWMLGWGDRLPLEVLMGAHAPSGEEHPGLTPGRDRVFISLRDVVTNDRNEARRRFRVLAPKIADRYLARMDLFAERSIPRFQVILDESRPAPPSEVVRALEKRLEAEARERQVSPSVVAGLKAQAEPHATTSDELLAMTRILLHRQARRNPQPTLFGVAEEEPETMRVGPHLAEGARVHLLHEHRRPLYYGLNTLCDAGSMNIEQFLSLCVPLVEEAEVRLIRRRPRLELDGVRQHELLRARASEAVKQHWRFPRSDEVLRLSDAIAALCLKRSLEPNAPLGPGANALGVPQADFDRLVKSEEPLRRVLHAALAYNALSIVRDHECKKRTWTLLQLNGMLILHHGLSLRWGGFVEARASDLLELLGGEQL